MVYPKCKQNFIPEVKLLLNIVVLYSTGISDSLNIVFIHGQGALERIGPLRMGVCVVGPKPFVG